MSSLKLKRLSRYGGVSGPLLLVILDGIGLYRGINDGYPGNAVDMASPDRLMTLVNRERISLRLKAHGTAVGLPSDEDQGNSEVGHNAMGAGRIYAQGARLIDEAISSERLFQGHQWKGLIENSLKNKTPVHLIGLVSDGNVHSNIAHLFALVDGLDMEGIEEVYIHGLLDGRDVAPLSALRYFGELEDHLWSLRSQGKRRGLLRRYHVASGGGRMVTTMDRYEADWSIVERGYNACVHGEGPLYADSLTAIREQRKRWMVDDQYLPHFVIHDSENRDMPLARISDGHSVILFNFRGDRALEICRAFVEEDFSSFPRPSFPKIFYAGMLEYDSDTHMPPHYLVAPPVFERTLSEYLAANGVTQYALSETQKFGHVTYFWNGNNSSKFDDSSEVWEEIESDRVPFDEKPAMKASEIADRTIEVLRSKKFKFMRINFPNGDMVGHTGVVEAAVKAVKAVDEALDRIIEASDEIGGTVVVTADHGNCEQMIAVDKKTGDPLRGAGSSYRAVTSHSLNPVPFVIHGPDTGRYHSDDSIEEPGLGNVASTILALLGFSRPEEYLKSLIKTE